MCKTSPNEPLICCSEDIIYRLNTFCDGFNLFIFKSKQYGAHIYNSDKLPKLSVTKYGMTRRYEWARSGRGLFKANM
jgi:hypothetical protein